MLRTLANDNVEVKQMLVSHLINVRFNGGMDMHAIRRRNLRNLIESEFGTDKGNVAAFGARHEIDEARLSQLLSDTYRDGKNFGEKAARTLEEKLSLSPMQLDRFGVRQEQSHYGNRRSDVLGSSPVMAIDDSEENPLLSKIRKVRLRLSAGIIGFSTDPEEEDSNPIYFRKDWLATRGYKPENLIAIRVKGESMEPNLHEDDTVVINTADASPKDGEVFAVNYEGEDVVKRLVRDAGTWWLSSDNDNQRRFPRKECSGDMCLIIGRVIHKQSERI